MFGKINPLGIGVVYSGLSKTGMVQAATNLQAGQGLAGVQSAMQNSAFATNPLGVGLQQMLVRKVYSEFQKDVKSINIMGFKFGL